MIKYTMVCTCDGCGEEICKAEPRATEINSARWDMNRYIRKTCGMIQECYRRPTKHFCGKCADRNNAAIKKHKGKP